MQAWRARQRGPRWVCLVEADNKLAIDLDNTLSVDTLLRAVRGREQATIEELYPAPGDLVALGPDGLPAGMDAPVGAQHRGDARGERVQLHGRAVAAAGERCRRE